jgi:hypothetical protein
MITRLEFRGLRETPTNSPLLASWQITDQSTSPSPACRMLNDRQPRVSWASRNSNQLAALGELADYRSNQNLVDLSREWQPIGLLREGSARCSSFSGQWQLIRKMSCHRAKSLKQLNAHAQSFDGSRNSKQLIRKMSCPPHRFHTHPPCQPHTMPPFF